MPIVLSLFADVLKLINNDTGHIIFGSVRSSRMSFSYLSALKEETFLVESSTYEASRIYPTSENWLTFEINKAK